MTEQYTCIIKHPTKPRTLKAERFVIVVKLYRVEGFSLKGKRKVKNGLSFLMSETTCRKIT